MDSVHYAGSLLYILAPTHSKESAVFSEIIEYQKVLKGLRAILGGFSDFLLTNPPPVQGLGFRVQKIWFWSF
jgi:hypothetical protein